MSSYPFPTPDSSDPGQLMELRFEEMTIEYRGEAFRVEVGYWFDPVTAEEFTTVELDTATFDRLHGAYRQQHGISSPTEISKL